jgi:hypothetical protein
MVVGHLALALAAKRVAPRINLGWLMAGVTALDLVWPILVLAGVERASIVPGATAFNALVFDYYPWSHSLLMALVWGIVLAGFARAADVPRSAAPLLILLVMSHWVLDVITHAPDMPLWPGRSPHLGLSLWDSITGTFVVEGLLWVAGIAIYLRSHRIDGLGRRIAFWSLVVVMTAGWASSPWSPPPGSARQLALFALIGWIIIPWSAWADGGRETRDAAGVQSA